MTDTQKLRALLDAATARPWRADVWYGTDDGGWAAIGPHCVASEADGFDDAPESSSYDQAMADAALIAGAVNALPELLDEVERLRARIDAVGQVLAESRCECPEGKHGDDSDDIATRGRTFIERLEAGQIPLRDGTDVTKALATAASLLRSCCGALASAERRTENAGAQASNAEAERAALRNIISNCATAIGNGSFCMPRSSVEFMAGIPAEIRAETGALRAEVSALRAEVERLKARTARLCAGCYGHGLAHLDGGAPKCSACNGAGAVVVEGEK